MDHGQVGPPPEDGDHRGQRVRSEPHPGAERKEQVAGQPLRESGACSTSAGECAESWCRRVARCRCSPGARRRALPGAGAPCRRRTGRRTCAASGHRSPRVRLSRQAQVKVPGRARRGPRPSSAARQLPTERTAPVGQRRPRGPEQAELVELEDQLPAGLRVGHGLRRELSSPLGISELERPGSPGASSRRDQRTDEPSLQNESVELEALPRRPPDGREQDPSVGKTAPGRLEPEQCASSRLSRTRRWRGRNARRKRYAGESSQAGSNSRTSTRMGGQDRRLGQQRRGAVLRRAGLGSAARECRGSDRSRRWRARPPGRRARCTCRRSPPNR